MQKAAEQWLRARVIIAEFLRELRPDHTREQLEHNAAAIIACLAGAEPPILLADPDELRE